MTFETVLRRF